MRKKLYLCGMNLIDRVEILRRRDMRDVFTLTIDPADAKDFDDALSFAKEDDDTYQVGVHIADVSHYVKPGSRTDDEAYQRGTSIYLVDRVLPMLPERLCNDLCSLRPNEDKLTMSVIFTIDKCARVKKHKLCRTVIRSNARLNYDQAQTIIAGAESGNEEWMTPELREAIMTLYRLSQILRDERVAKGAMTIEQDEIRFRLDEHGHPVDIYFEHPNEAHHLIEEWMLLANRTVAQDVASIRKRGGATPPFIYRVHDKPNEDKLNDLALLEQKMGGALPQEVRDILMIRAQAKAVYATKNIGHYGLRFEHYTHFTSPIRRYPDLIVHRLLTKYILTGKGESLPIEVLDEMCTHLSEQEQAAQQAERESVKMYQALWMEDHIGEEMEGYICSVTDFGFFVRLDESRCEGLVSIRKLCPGEYMIYEEQGFALRSSDSDTRYALGDRVRVKVAKADAEKGQIDFDLIEDKEQKI